MIATTLLNLALTCLTVAFAAGMVFVATKGGHRSVERTLASASEFLLAASALSATALWAATLIALIWSI